MVEVENAERMPATGATRAVDDAKDTGTIHLVTYLYRPVRGDRVLEPGIQNFYARGRLLRRPLDRPD